MSEKFTMMMLQSILINDKHASQLKPDIYFIMLPVKEWNALIEKNKENFLLHQYNVIYGNPIAHKRIQDLISKYYMRKELFNQEEEENV